MTDKVDYASLRVLPYAVLVMFIAMPVLAVIAVLVIAASMNVGISDQSVYGVIRALYSNGLFLNDVAVITTLVCLYRLNDLTKWFRCSWMLFAAELIAKLVQQVFDWGQGKLPGQVFFQAGSMISAVLPELCFVLGVLFLLKGFCDIYGTVDEGEIPACQKLIRVWIGLQGVRLAVLTVLYLMVLACQLLGVSSLTDAPEPLAGAFVVCLVVSLLLLAAHAAVGCIVYVKSGSACRDYYIYSYNGGIQGGGHR